MITKSTLLALVTIGVLVTLFATTDYAPTSKIPDEVVSQFNEWTKKYKRQYLSLSERNYRLEVFYDNVKYIQAHNARKLGWTLTTNKFADLTFDEFDKAYLIQNPKQFKPFDGPLTFKVLKEKNWLKEGKVTPVKDQSTCSDCYAFGALSSLESALAIKHNKHIILSEKEVIDCTSKYGNNGCKGGQMDQTFRYIINKKIALNSDYPYKPVVETCTVDKSKERYTMHHYKHINPANMDGLLKALDQQPISVCFDCRRDFHLYEKGVYKGEPGCGTKFNHCILAFGYGTDEETKEDFTYMKNSWNNDWGEAGMIRFLIKGGSGTCAVGNYDDIYPVLGDKESEFEDEE